MFEFAYNYNCIISQVEFVHISNLFNMKKQNIFFSFDRLIKTADNPVNI